MLAVLFAAAPVSSFGAVILEEGAGSTVGEANVLFNAEGLDLEGPLVEGEINGTELIVNFFGAGEDLEGDGGQAKVEAADGELRSLSIALADPAGTFTSLHLNLFSSDDGLVSFVVDRAVGSDVTFTNRNLDKNGNIFRFGVDAGDLLKSVTFTTNVDLDDVRQVRIGGAALPEPASLGLLALGGLALMRRRRA